jgi:biopolymer transport protein ExbD
MIDVVFLLLIYFVVTASFSLDEGAITAKLPHGPEQHTVMDPQVPLQVTIASAGLADYRITIDGLPEAPGDFAALTKLMREFAAAGVFDPAQKRVVIKPDRHVRWQHVTNAFNAFVAAEYLNVSFVSIQ